MTSIEKISHSTFLSVNAKKKGKLMLTLDIFCYFLFSSKFQTAVQFWVYKILNRKHFPVCSNTDKTVTTAKHATCFVQMILHFSFFLAFF